MNFSMCDLTWPWHDTITLKRFCLYPSALIIQVFKDLSKTAQEEFFLKSITELQLDFTNFPPFITKMHSRAMPPGFFSPQSVEVADEMIGK